jgi:hypothetical protein
LGRGGSLRRRTWSQQQRERKQAVRDPRARQALTTVHEGHREALLILEHSGQLPNLLSGRLLRQLRHEGFEIGRQIGNQSETLAAPGMGKLQLRGMQEVACEYKPR